MLTPKTIKKFHGLQTRLNEQDLPYSYAEESDGFIAAPNGLESVRGSEGVVDFENIDVLTILDGQFTTFSNIPTTI